MSDFQGAMQGAPQALQGRVGRCHQLAGEVAEAAPEHEQMDVYLSRLKPCFKEEEAKLDSLFAGARVVLDAKGGPEKKAAKKGWF
jgi:hypothetical protein